MKFNVRKAECLCIGTIWGWSESLHSSTAVVLLTAIYVYILTSATSSAPVADHARTWDCRQKAGLQKKKKYSWLHCVSFEFNCWQTFVRTFHLSDGQAGLHECRVGFSCWEGLNWSLKFTVVGKMYTKIRCEYLYYSLNLQNLFQTRSSMFNAQFNAAIPFYKWLAWK